MRSLPVRPTSFLFLYSPTVLPCISGVFAHSVPISEQLIESCTTLSVE
jgi:hypothetical protein